jgi:hypothetical protein
MDIKLIEKWKTYSYKLKEYFEKNKQEDYSDYYLILKKTIDLVLNNGNQNIGDFDIEEITKIDNGDYQGTLLFIFHRKTYQPYITDYYYTYVEYGSCSGCDTLLAINEYEDGLPNEQQVKDYMTLALHLVEGIKNMKDEEDY